MQFLLPQGLADRVKSFISSLPEEQRKLAANLLIDYAAEWVRISMRNQAEKYKETVGKNLSALLR